MNRLKILLSICFFYGIVVSGQVSSRVMYFMNVPQARFLNPAIAPSDSVYIGLPGISGVGMNLNNNLLNFSDLIIKGRTDSLITFLHPEYDKDEFLAKVHNSNSAQVDVTVQLLGLGFRVGKGFLFIDLNERMNTIAAFPGSVIELAVRGNEGYAGETIDFTGLKGGFTYFREAGIGYSRNLPGGFRAGIRGKFLFGLGTMSSDIRSLGVTVQQDYSHLVEADAGVNISAPLMIGRDNEGRISEIDIDGERAQNTILMKNGINPGAAFDLGLTWQPSARLSFSGAVTDLGFIRWKNDATNLMVKQQFEFTGIDASGAFTGDQTFEEAADELLDSLQNMFSISEGHLPFTSWLPATVNLGAGYSLTKSFSLGFLSQSRFAAGKLSQSMTLSANLNVRSNFSASLSYTAANHRYDNFGVGLAFRLGPFQFYAVSDRIPVVWNRIVTDDGGDFIVPAQWNTFDLRLGLNLLFGHGRKPKAEECVLPEY